MKSSFDGSCAFDGSSCGKEMKPSIASLSSSETLLVEDDELFRDGFASEDDARIISGCALEDDEVASKPSAALEYHRMSPRRRKGIAEKRRSAKRVVILCIREEEGKQERFSFVDNDETVRLLEILD